MTSQVTCPRCNQLVDPQKRYCDHCGVDLALAAALAEPTVLPLSQTPKAPEALVPRLGDYLIEKGVLSPEQMQCALQYQREQVKAGRPSLIGQTLLEMGLIERATLDEAVTEQILQLQTALQQANRQLEQRVQERTADLQRALNKLTEINQLKTNFISNVSHELRTPLTHIKGYLDILADGSLGLLNPQQLDAARVMQRAEARLEKLIEDLIQFSLAARGELSIQISPFDIVRLIHICVSQSNQKARTAQVSLELSLPAQLPKVRADEEKIGWVLMQLLDNAIKFNATGGRVITDARLDNDIVTIAVTDTGIGIPEDRVQDIFEPFHQLDGSATRRYGGTGLGLTMVRRILDAHGADIRVRSVVGRGSRFEFSLPVDTQ